MITADVAVLTTRLPFVDRGTLSRAWYDALHLAHPQSGFDAEVKPWPNAAAQVRQTVPNEPSLRGGKTAQASLAAVTRSGGKALGNAPVVHHTMPAARRIAQRCRTLGAQSRPKTPTRLAAVVQLPHGERVCLLMQGDRNGLRVTALCSPALRVRVALALAHVQWLLAAGGVACNMQIGALHA